jgi:hypothetical protein
MIGVLEENTASTLHHENGNIVFLRNTGNRLTDAEQAGVAITPQTHIPEVLGLSLVRNTCYPG